MFHVIIEKALQKTLEYRPELAEKCRLLGEKDIVITLLPLNLSWTITFFNGDVRCFHGKDLEFKKPDLFISATPSALMAMILRDDKTQLYIEGDVVVAQVLQQCFHYADIDWEPGINEIFGEALSYPIRKGLRQTYEKVQHIHQRLKNKIMDCGQEEVELIPLSTEINIFYHEVDELKLRVDRLEAHIKKRKQG